MLDLQQVQAVYDRHRRATPFVLFGLIFLFLLGVWLSFIRPGQLVASARRTAETEIARAESAIAGAKGKVGQLKWFQERYSKEPSSKLRDAEAALTSGPEGGAKALFEASAGGGGWKERRRAAEQAATLAGTAATAAEAATRSINDAIARKEKAQRDLQTLAGIVESVSQGVDPLDTRLKDEVSRYPSHYGRKARGEQSVVAEGLGVLRAKRGDASNYLPAEEKEGEGDPDGALVVLTPAITDATRVQGALKDLLEWLDLTNTRYREADRLVGQCEEELRTATRGLQDRQDRTQYWLNSASAILAEGSVSARSARALLTAVSTGESVPDRPLAYQTAEHSVVLCKRAIADADKEIELAAEVGKKLQTLSAEIAAFALLVGGYDANFSILREHHGVAAWKHVETLPREVGPAQVRGVRSRLATVRDLASLEQQRFQDANQQADTQLAEVRDWAKRATVLQVLVTELEASRQSYPKEYDNAQSIVDRERSNIREYGDYDDGAKRSFKDAEKNLRSAKNYAGDRLYAEAIRLAKLAANQANGTGRRARAAYDDAQAAAALAAAAAAAASDDSSSSSWDSGSSSSSSSWGSSDSGWSGGSDSSWGGGSDSDW